MFSAICVSCFSISFLDSTDNNFELFSDADSYVTPFESNLSRGQLLAGYTTELSPVGTTIIRVKSNGTTTPPCNDFIDIDIDLIPVP